MSGIIKLYCVYLWCNITKCASKIVVKVKPSVVSLIDKDTKHITEYRCKYIIFHGKKPSDFKDWWDIIFTALEMENIEDHVADTW